MGYFIDGVVMTTGCDKTTPACLMAAATVNIPAIVLSGGPMNNGWRNGERVGSGTIVWQARQELAEGKIDYEEFMAIVTDLGALGRPLQHDGHRFDDERARRGARHEPAGLRGHSRSPSRARADRLSRPASASSKWSTRI